MKNNISERYIPECTSNKAWRESKDLQHFNLFSQKDLSPHDVVSFKSIADELHDSSLKKITAEKLITVKGMKATSSTAKQLNTRKHLADILNFHQPSKVYQFCLHEKGSKVCNHGEDGESSRHTTSVPPLYGNVKSELKLISKHSFSAKELYKIFSRNRFLKLSEMSAIYFRQLAPYRVLDAPYLRNDFYSNLVSWSSVNGSVSVGLGSSVHLWKKESGTDGLLPSTFLSPYNDFVTCVSFSPLEPYLIIGTKNGQLILLSQQRKHSARHGLADHSAVMATFTTSSRKGICCIKWFQKRSENEFLCGNECGEVYHIRISDIYQEDAARVGVANRVRAINSTTDHPVTQNRVSLQTEQHSSDEYLSLRAIPRISNARLSDERLNRGTNNGDVAESEWDIPDDVEENWRDDMGEESSNYSSQEDNDETSDVGLDSAGKILKHEHTKVYKIREVALLKCQAQQVCGIDINEEQGHIQMAVGGNDNTCSIWNITDISNPVFQYNLFHKAAIKAVSFCPWAKNLLATGGGSKDRCIRFWHTGSGVLLKEIKTSGQITSLVWSSKKKQITASFGFNDPENPLLLRTYSYPSMSVVAQVSVAKSLRVLSTALSPDKTCVCIATNDETVRFFKLWDAKDADMVESQVDGIYNMHQNELEIRHSRPSKAGPFAIKLQPEIMSSVQLFWPALPSNIAPREQQNMAVIGRKIEGTENKFLALSVVDEKYRDSALISIPLACNTNNTDIYCILGSYRHSDKRFTSFFEAGTKLQVVYFESPRMWQMQFYSLRPINLSTPSSLLLLQFSQENNFTLVETDYACSKYKGFQEIYYSCHTLKDDNIQSVLDEINIIDHHFNAFVQSFPDLPLSKRQRFFWKFSKRTRDVYLEYFFVDGVRSLTLFLSKSPFGIKLNDELSNFLRELFLGIIEFFHEVYLKQIVSPAFLSKVIKVVGLASYLCGATFALSICIDYLSLISLHLKLFYRISSKLYGWQLSLMRSLFYLFCGKKNNVLRSRVDNEEFPLDVMLMGILFFVILVFLLPTVFAFYITYSVLEYFTAITEIFFESAVMLLNHFPLFVLMLRCKDSARVPGGIKFDICHERSLVLDDGITKNCVPSIKLQNVPLNLTQIFGSFRQVMKDLSDQYFSLGTLKSIFLGRDIAVHRTDLYATLYSSIPAKVIGIQDLQDLMKQGFSDCGNEMKKKLK
ncbi:hypothetical protein ACO0QE_001722 [Hanseniaspora vineae]